MLNCPFCGFDYSEVGLRDSRCRNCGSVLAWDNEADVSESLPLPKLIIPDTSTQYLSLEEYQKLQSRREPPTKLEEPAEGSKATRPIDSAFRIPAVAADTTSFLPPPQNETPRFNLNEVNEQLTSMWGKPIEEGSANPLMTIKGSSAKETVVSDSVLAIHAREVRRPDDTTKTASDYELLDVIGEGGIGIIYSARQGSIDRNVAIKMLRKEFQDREDHRDKFLAEAVVTGDLNHPNIVPIYDLGRAPSGELFYSMKRVVGTPWDKVILQKPRTENLEILLKVADAIAFAHSRGVVHRDLKPENVMIGEFGEVLVMDWGIALPTVEFRKTANISKSLSMGGTPAYMAPEMALGPPEKISHLSDVYLLGAILFEIIAGKPPHTGRNVYECIRAAANNAIQPTAERGELLDIAMRAMATRPNARYPSVQAFQAAIRDYQAHSESIVLSDRAEIELQTARSSQKYEDYSRALFAFQEAYSLWTSNDLALAGITETKLAYAETALKKGDYDLGLSLIDDSSSVFDSLRQRLQAAQKERDARQFRLQSVRRLVALLVLFIFVAGGMAFALILSQLNETKAEREKVDFANKQLRKNEIALKEQFEALQIAQRTAKDEAAAAIRQKNLADKERQRADELRLATAAAKQVAEEKSYFAEIGLAGEKLSSNAFGVARQILEDLKGSNTKSKLRHWEWGRYAFVAHGGLDSDAERGVRAHRCLGTVQSMSVTPQGFLILGTVNGKIEIWELAGDRPLHICELGRSVRAVAVASNGLFFAAAGTDAKGEGTAAVWEWRDFKQAPVKRQDLKIGRTTATALSFSRSPTAELLFIGDDERNINIVRWPNGTQLQRCEGHFENVTDLDVSYDDQFIASSSEDGTVRVWEIATGLEKQRFRAHRSAVFAVSFSPDRKRIASAGADQRILLWNLDPTQSQETLVENAKKRLAGESTEEIEFLSGTGHTNTIRDLNFSQDGSKIISAAQDQTICIWSAIQNATEDAALKASDVLPLVSTLRGHGGWVSACCFFGADGETVCSGGHDQEWRLWKLDRYQERREFREHDQPIVAAEYFPDGRRVLIALSDGTLLVRDASTGQLLNELDEGHIYLTAGAHFLKNGEKLLTYAGDDSVRIWDIASGAEVMVLPNAGRLGITAVSRDEKLLATATEQRRVKLWDLETGKSLSELSPHQAKIDEFAKDHSEAELEKFIAEIPETSAIAVSDTGNQIATGDANGTVRFWNRQGKLIAQVPAHTSSVSWAGFLPGNDNAGTFITASTDGTAAFWNSLTGEEQASTRLKHGMAITSATLNKQADTLVTHCSLGEQGSLLQSWEVPSGKLLKRRELRGVTISHLAFEHGTNPKLLVTCVDSKDGAPSVMNWDCKSDQLDQPNLKQLLGSGVVAVVPSTDNKHLLTVGGRGARLWNPSSQRETMSFRPAGTIRTIAISQNGLFMAAGAADGSIKVWDLESMQVTRKLLHAHQGPVHSVGLNATGSTLVSVGDDGRVVYWTLGSSSEGQLLGKSDQPSRCLAMSSDGNLLFVASEGSAGTLWNLATKTIQQRIAGHQETITAAAFSSDHQWLATGSTDKLIRLWRVSDGALLGSFEGHAGTINSLHFSADALRVLSASQDSTAKLWDVRSLIVQSDINPEGAVTEQQFNEILTLNRHNGEVTSARFSPRGDEVMTVGTDRLAVIWPGAPVPPAIALSSPGINYSTGSGPMVVDDKILLSEPTRQSWSDWRIRIWTDSRTELRESLGFVGTIDDSRVQLKFTQPNEIDIRFAKDVSASDVRQLMRRLTYTCDCEKNVSNRNQNLHIRISSIADQQIDTHTETKTIHLDLNEASLAVHDRIGLTQ